MLILQQMIVLFLVMLAGFLAEQKKILDEDACKKISWIVVNIANPAMILSSVSGGSRIQPEELAVTVLIATTMFLCLILAAALLCYIKHVAKRVVIQLFIRIRNIIVIIYKILFPP